MGAVLPFERKSYVPMDSEPIHLDFREMLYLRCDGCHFEWKAPKLGACPKCHGSKTWVFGAKRETAPRV